MLYFAFAFLYCQCLQYTKSIFYNECKGISNTYRSNNHEMGKACNMHFTILS